MTYQDYFGAFSLVCAAAQYGSYIRTILQNKTKPHFFSWAIWAAVIAIIFVAQVSKGGGSGTWVTGFSAMGCLTIAVFALKKGEKNITRSDWVAFIGALMIIPVWRITEDALWAVILGTTIDAMAYYPTYRKTWHRPYEENPVTYAIDVCKWSVALIALQNHSATSIIYPLFCVCANSSMVAMILWRRSKVSVA